MNWRWVDRIDAHSWREYDWKNNDTIPGLSEGFVDFLFDKGLGASFDIHIYFLDTEDYPWKRTPSGSYMPRPRGITIKK